MVVIKNFFNYLWHHKWLAIILIIIIAVLIYSFKPKPAPPVQTTTVSRGDVTQSISISGKVNAKNIADLSFLAGGKLTYLGVKVGDHVNQYQTIATVDMRTAQKNLQAVLIAYDKQRNTFDQTRDNNQNRTPDQALNDAMKRVLQNNQYDLNNAVNSVELQSIAQESSILTAPIAGIVTRADAKSTGINVTPATVFEIIDPQSLVFDMDVDEADIGKVKNGQQADITLDAYPDENLKLPVNFIDFISHTTTTGGNAYTVEVNLNDPGAQKYRVGLNGNAEIITNEKHDVLHVPLATVVDNKYVYIKSGKGFEKRNVKLGLQTDVDAEIVDGLNEGDVIAVDPVAAAKLTK